MRPERGIFVAGTDTAAGKTVMKPFASGGWSDTLFLKKTSGVSETGVEITPFYFKHPLAPYASLRLEKRRFEPRGWVRRLGGLWQRHDFWVVEGIGGARVPITKDYDCLDAAKELGFPVVIVSRLGLGAINHSLLTVRSAQERGLRVLGIVLNATSSRAGLAERTNPRVIAELADVPVLGVFPHLSDRDLKNPAQLARIAKKHLVRLMRLC
jgi:dethiobiotin synthetase